MGENRIQCPWYFKTRVCHRENHCPHQHNRPTILTTLFLSEMYQPPDMIIPGIDARNPIDPDQIQEHFENFYKDIFKMLSEYGEIMWLNVCDNPANHMIGNVYVQFRREKQAEAALRDLQGKLYNLQPIKVEYSPVTKFHYATCFPFEENRCIWGSDCNFLHVKKIRHELNQKLLWSLRYSRSESRNPGYRKDRESRERSHERGDHNRDRDRVRHERRYERRSRRSRYSRSQSRSGSPIMDRESRERSHERGDHNRDRDRVRHERRYERMSRRLRYSRSRQSRSRSPSYRRDGRERPHERGDHRRNSELDRDRERYERRSRNEGRSRSPVRVRVRNGGLRLKSVIVREEKEKNDE